MIINNNMASSQTIRDFILISEFCEVEGPRCVLTIPAVLPHLNNNENFNLDEFLLYIMTTDYQNFPGYVFKIIQNFLGYFILF